jgi:hypothetical protein
MLLTSMGSKGSISVSGFVWGSEKEEGLGVADRLAICGIGEKEKMGEKGRFRLLLVLVLLIVGDALGGVKGGRDLCLDSKIGWDFNPEMEEGGTSCMTFVDSLTAALGVARVWVRIGGLEALDVVDRRFFFGWPFA